MKKFLVALLMAAMTVSAVGCGNSGGAAADNNAPAESAPEAPASTESNTNTEASGAGTEQAASGEVQDITLKVWCPQNQVDCGIMDQQQQGFAAEHPEYNITLHG